MLHILLIKLFIQCLAKLSDIFLPAILIKFLGYPRKQQRRKSKWLIINWPTRYSRLVYNSTILIRIPLQMQVKSSMRLMMLMKH